MSWISNWAETVIIAVIIGTIIEMILPEGSSKKYIKIVIGVYILFTIISPLINRFSGGTLQVSDIIDLDKYVKEVKEKEIEKNLLQENNTSSIREIYIGNLKADIQNKLKGKGYIVTYIDLDVGYDDNYTLNQITLSVDKEKNIDNDNTNESSIENENIQVVNEINISLKNMLNNDIEDKVKESNISSKEKNKIKEYLSDIYEINEENILIN